MTRRDFLTAAASVSLAATTASSGAASRPSPVIDAHVHCFAGPASDTFPYHVEAPYRPEAAPPERLLELMDGAGVDGAVLVHPEPYQDDHRYLEHCLAIGRGRLKATCLFFADHDDSIDRLRDLVRRHPGKIVALRVHAYAPERLPPFDSPALHELWKAAADLGLTVQIHFEPRYAPAFEPLIREFRETTVLVDHLGRPFQGTEQEHAVVVDWAKYSHVVMKLSSVPVRENYPHRDPTSVIHRLVEAFGPARLVYGGGFGATATAESYRATRERLVAHLPEMPAADVDQILGGNAARLFGFA